MAKSKKFGYVEPDNYFPPEVLKMFEKADKDQNPAAAEKPKNNPYRDESKRLIEKDRKKKAAKK